MKKSALLLALLFFFSSISVYAQFGQRGQVEIGGAISYSSVTSVSNGEKDKNSSSLLEFMPYISYFITNGFSLGIAPGVNMMKPAGSDDSITNLMLFAVPGFTFQTRGTVFPFIQALVGYTSITSDSDPTGGSGKLENSGISYGGRAGVKIQVGKNGLGTLGVSYMMYTFNPKGADKRYGMDHLAITLGFSVFLDN